MRFTTALTAAIAAQITQVSADTQVATVAPPAALSILGTLLAPALPQFLTNNPLPNGFPWGLDTVFNTNPYTNPPNTGVVRPYDLTIARGSVAPDGVNRSSILINGMFPGPTLEANWGDTFQITVHNKITGPEEPTSLHWHGILQKTTPFEDGIPGVQQCPIAPGASQTFTFKADLYGTSWYHSHLSAQYAAGLFGPMVIHGPLHYNYDKDLGPVILSDWYHKTYTELVEQVVDPAPLGTLPPSSQNQLINGKTDAQFNFTSGTSYRLRLVNTAAEGTFVYSIDEHEFTVIAHDFVPVQPYTTKNVTLSVGQRADIVVKATGNKTRSYYMRSISNACSVHDAGHDTALATIFYEKADRSQKPTSAPVNASTACDFPILDIKPAFPITPPSQPATTAVLNITFGNNGTDGNPGSNVFFMNGSSFHANYDEPPLLLAHAGNTSYDPAAHWNVYNFGSNSSVRIVVYNTFVAAHPMHLHGHNFWVLAQGHGEWDGKITNANNPQRRDVYLMTGAPDVNTPSYIVIEFNQDNPGVWPFHCHIAWHVSGGLYINVLERPADIKNINIPQSVQDTCTNYKAWQAKGNIVDEIDSGERKRSFVRW